MSESDIKEWPECTIQTMTVCQIKQEGICDEDLSNWPVVYIITGNDGRRLAYVGESSDVCSRMKQHIYNYDGMIHKNPGKLTKVTIIFNERFNKSATLDFEQSLIRLLASEYKMLNGNLGISPRHRYYQREYYSAMMLDIWNKLVKESIVEHSLTSARNSQFYKLSPFVSLNSQQAIIAQDILTNIASTLVNNYSDGGKDESKGMTVVRGGAGTGKSILAIHLIKIMSTLSKKKIDPSQLSVGELNEEFDLYDLRNFVLKNNQKFKIGIVVPVKSFYNTVRSVFKNTDGLFCNMVLRPSEAALKRNEYDVLIVDESHRLCQRKNIRNYGAFDATCKRVGKEEGIAQDAIDQLDWVRYGSRYQILLYDPDQTVKSSDISESDFRARLDSYCPVEHILDKQERCRVADGYNEYIKSVLRPDNISKLKKMDFGHYSIGVFDQFEPMYDLIQHLDARDDDGLDKLLDGRVWGCCRVVAGYSWPWTDSTLKSRKARLKSGVKDVHIENKFYQWNTTDEGWPLVEDTTKEIGCIHTVQGYDLNYVGVVFGPEISYDKNENKINIDISKFHDTKVKENTEISQVKEFILNSYFVMMTRGMYGCFIYACDPSLRDYLKKMFGRTDADKMKAMIRKNEKYAVLDLD